MLHAKRRINPAPYVNGIVALNNVLAPVVQTAIAQKKSRATECEIFLVVPRDAVRNENQSGTVKFPVPPSTAAGNAYFCRLIHFGVDERFMPSFVPSPPAEHSHPVFEWLFEIEAKPVFDSGL